MWVCVCVSVSVHVLLTFISQLSVEAVKRVCTATHLRMSGIAKYYIRYSNILMLCTYTVYAYISMGTCCNMHIHDHTAAQSFQLPDPPRAPYIIHLISFSGGEKLPPAPRSFLHEHVPHSFLCPCFIYMHRRTY